MPPFSRNLYFFVILLTTNHVYVMFRYRHAVKELEGWGVSTNRNISHYMNAEVKNLPENFCKYSTKLLIVVQSRPQSIDARNAVRQTWGNQTRLNHYNASLFFLLGQSKYFSVPNETALENSLYHDIIIGSFIDNYLNLTLKSFTMLKLFNGRKCKYLLKTDEDVFVNVGELNCKLKGRKNENNLLMGRLVKNEKRQNDYQKNWYAPKYMYLPHKYPNFLAGPAYIMSLDVASKLYQVALQVPLFHLEDVFLTGICAQKAGIKRLNHKFFTDFGGSRYKKSKVNFCKLITLHSFTPDGILKIQQHYTNLNCPNV